MVKSYLNLLRFVHPLFQTSVWGSFLGATRLWFGHGLAFLGPKSGRCWAGGNPKSQLLMGGIPIGSMVLVYMLT